MILKKAAANANTARMIVIHKGDTFFFAINAHIPRTRSRGEVISGRFHPEYPAEIWFHPTAETDGSRKADITGCHATHDCDTQQNDGIDNLLCFLTNDGFYCIDTQHVTTVNKYFDPRRTKATYVAI
jgi:hypothetical protein